MNKKIDLKYLGNIKLNIPRLKSRGGMGVKLPLMDYNNKKPFPADKQILTVSENEANDLMRCWPGLFEVIKKANPKINKKETKGGNE